MGFRVIAIDGGDEKKDMCVNKLGAEVFVDFTKEDVVESVKSHTGGLGAHAVILLAVSEGPFQQATEVRTLFLLSDISRISSTCFHLLEGVYFGK